MVYTYRKGFRKGKVLMPIIGATKVLGRVGCMGFIWLT